MSRSLTDEILDLTIRQGFDIQFTTFTKMETWSHYFVIIVTKGNYHQKITIDINEISAEYVSSISIENYIVKTLEQSAKDIIKEIEKGKQK